MNKRNKILAIISIVLLLTIFIGVLIGKISSWYDTHTIKRNKIVQVEFHRPFEIHDRKIPEAEIIKVVEEIPEYDELVDIEKYICDKWGVYECKVAIAIARAESGLREDAYNVNGNGTFDYGIFQINSVHHDKDGCSMKELVDAKGNVDCAYSIYEASGWSAWSAYKSGSFKDNL